MRPRAPETMLSSDQPEILSVSSPADLSSMYCPLALCVRAAAGRHFDLPRQAEIGERVRWGERFGDGAKLKFPRFFDDFSDAPADKPEENKRNDDSDRGILKNFADGVFGLEIHTLILAHFQTPQFLAHDIGVAPGDLPAVFDADARIGAFSRNQDDVACLGARERFTDGFASIHNDG